MQVMDKHGMIRRHGITSSWSDVGEGDNGRRKNGAKVENMVNHYLEGKYMLI